MYEIAIKPLQWVRMSSSRGLYREAPKESGVDDVSKNPSALWEGRCKGLYREVEKGRVRVNNGERVGFVFYKGELEPNNWNWNPK